MLEKNTRKRIKREEIDKEKISTHISNKELVSRIYKKLSQLNKRKTTTQFKGWPKYMDTSTKKMLPRGTKGALTGGMRASLVVQQLRIRLPTQGRPLTPGLGQLHSLRATRPLHN